MLDLPYNHLLISMKQNCYIKKSCIGGFLDIYLSH